MNRGAVIVAAVLLGMASPLAAGVDAPSPEMSPAKNPFSGSYLLTVNGSVLGKINPSTGHRLLLSYAPEFGGSIDGRAEYYNDGSYNADPPGVLNRNINEEKFEGQLMYNRPLAYGFGVTAGLLHHENFRFADNYFWTMAGVTYSVSPMKDLTLSLAALGEKKWWTGRLFYDFSGTVEYRFVKDWNVQATLHRYENFGQFDAGPTEKQELEVGVNYAITPEQTVGVSFFRHIQFDAPNDQFSFVKLKWLVSF